MPAPPPDLTIATLRTATRAKCREWGDMVNEEIGGKKKLILAKFSVAELRARLAAYYKLDLSQPLDSKKIPLPGLSKIDMDIQKRQWEHLVALGAEWMKKGNAFLLTVSPSNSPPSSFNQLPGDVLGPSEPSTLPQFDFASASVEVPPPSSHLLPDPETAAAYSMAAREYAALPAAAAAVAASAQFQQPITILPSPPSTLAGHAGHQLAVAPTNGCLPMSLVFLPPPSPTGVPSSHHLLPPVTTHQESSPPPPPSLPYTLTTPVLASAHNDVDALAEIDDMRAAIAQCESGEIDALHEKYGPKTTASGKRIPAHKYWQKINGKVTRRKRVYKQLMDADEFNGNKEAFYAFLEEAERRRLPAGPAPPNGGTPKLVPYRAFAQAIPHRNDDLEEERKASQYLGEDGSFSQALWDAKWHGANGWEVWRALGKERYSL